MVIPDFQPLLRRKRKHRILEEKLLIGWQEWCALPKLHLPAIKAKIDTGAKTSAIHADNITPFMRQGKPYVHFEVAPLQGTTHPNINCTAPVIGERHVTSSNGHRELRYVIQTPILLGEQTWMIELTLSNRDPLSFRLLLGREALKGRVLIKPHAILRQGQLSQRSLKSLYF
jgi:ribosomal protein S6--L-glutamate ligase